MKDNQATGPVTEEELKAKSTGRRVTLEDVHDSVGAIHFFSAGQGTIGAEIAALLDQGQTQFTGSKDGPKKPLDLLTFCVITMTNGYTVVGQSACADPSNFNEEIGRRIAREDAIKKIWPLLGFQLCEDIARDHDLTSGRAFAEMPGFGVYIGTKVVHATPMSRAIYNDFRGWTMPENEEDDEGYLVEYTDGGQANVEGFAGYISWSPKGVFERSYRAVGQAASAAKPAPGQTGTGASVEDSWENRLLEERRQLSDRCGKLATFLSTDQFRLLPHMEQYDLTEQKRHMDGYLMILNYRVARLPGEYPKAGDLVELNGSLSN